ncbi:MAG: host attachment protein [Hydrogenophilaceae bacterium]|nr:host attachment protein [Hydrogenophilaceae bacterium]
MSTTWILVANASQAKLYANRGPKKGLELLKELDHPESREKGSNLVSDRPGHIQGHGNGHGSYVPPTDPKEHEADRFALELAREMEEGRTSNAYDRLIIAASSPFLGMLNGRLSNQVKGKLAESIEKDYTRMPVKELTGYLESHIFL